MTDYEQKAVESAMDIHNQDGDAGYVRAILYKGYDSYTWSKEKALQSKVLKPRLEPSLAFIESKLSEAKGKLPVEKVVDALDSRIDNTLKYSTDTIQVVVNKPTELKNGTLMVLHKNLGKLKTEEGTEEETKEDEGNEKENEEPTLKVIYSDVKEITTQRAAKVLDASENLVNRYLPESEVEAKQADDESLTTAKSNAAYRAFTLSKVVTKRMQRRALSRLDRLKLRTQEVTHVDLVKYSDMLDSRKAWLAKRKDGVKASVNERVVKPLRGVGARMDHGYGDLKEKAKQYQAAARKSIVQLGYKIPFSDKIINAWTVLGDQCDQKIVKPAEKIVETFKVELHKQQEIVKNKEDDPNKPLTIEAGLRAVVAAARFRLKKEWESRVAPGIEAVVSKTPFAKKANKDTAAEDPTFKVGSSMGDDESEESNESSEPLFDAQD